VSTTKLIPAGELSIEVGWDGRTDRLVLGFFVSGSLAPTMAFGIDSTTALELVETMLAELKRREAGDA
jgi:hypothetical protein